MTGTGAARLLAFYRGEAVDDRGRTIAEVQALDLDALEHTHDYIQWLFPLFERSRVHPEVPVLDEATARRMSEDPEVRATLRRSAEVMLGFYGLRIVEGANGLRIVAAPDVRERQRVWLTPMNHNYLRLTRILRSLTILGEGELARSLLACLEGIYAEHREEIGAEALAYWTRAVSEG